MIFLIYKFLKNNFVKIFLLFFIVLEEFFFFNIFKYFFVYGFLEIFYLDKFDFLDLWQLDKNISYFLLKKIRNIFNYMFLYFFNYLCFLKTNVFYILIFLEEKILLFSEKYNITSFYIDFGHSYSQFKYMFYKIFVKPFKRVANASFVIKQLRLTVRNFEEELYGRIFHSANRQRFQWKKFLSKPFVFVKDKIKFSFYLFFFKIDKKKGYFLSKDFLFEGSFSYRRKVSIFKNIFRKHGLLPHREFSNYHLKKSSKKKIWYFHPFRNTLKVTEKKRRPKLFNWLLHNYFRKVGPYRKKYKKFLRLRSFHSQGRFHIINRPQKIISRYSVSVIALLIICLYFFFFIFTDVLGFFEPEGFGDIDFDDFNSIENSGSLNFFSEIELLDEINDISELYENAQDDEEAAFTFLLKSQNKDIFNDFFVDEDAYWQWLVSYPVFIKNPLKSNNNNLEGEIDLGFSNPYSAENESLFQGYYDPPLNERFLPKKNNYNSYSLSELKDFSFLYPLYKQFKQHFPYSLKDFLFFKDSGRAYFLLFCYIIYIPIGFLIFIIKYLLKFIKLFFSLHFFIKILLFLIFFFFFFYIFVFF